MKNFKFSFGFALVAVGVLNATNAFAYDETRCSGKGCLNAPMQQTVMHNEAVVFDEHGNALVFTDGDYEVIVDENGLPVTLPESQDYQSY